MNFKRTICIIAAMAMVLLLGACTVVEPQNNAGTQASGNVTTEAPTGTSTEVPTDAPTDAPTETPTNAPTETPTNAPAGTPTDAPTNAPTGTPTNAPTDAPTEAPTEPSADNYKAPENYEEYIAMSGEDQMRFINSFPSVDAFVDWVTAAREEYEASKDKTPLGPGGIIDVGGN